MALDVNQLTSCWRALLSDRPHFPPAPQRLPRTDGFVTALWEFLPAVPGVALILRRFAVL